MNWKYMNIEDKLLFIIERLSYFLAVSTFIILIFIINKNFVDEIFILFFVVLGFFGCGQNAKYLRD